MLPARKMEFPRHRSGRAKKTGVPSRTIKALAREWAAKKTVVAHVFGGPYIRGPYSSEPARLEVCLLGMQGLGKPGVHQLCFLEGTFIAKTVTKKDIGQQTPGGLVRPMVVEAAYRGYHPFMPKQKQIIPKPMMHDAILKGHFEIYGSSDQMEPVEDQFKHYVYPLPGKSEVHMLWSDTPCFTTCWNDGNCFHSAMRSPKIEFILIQHPWLESDCLFADILLPVKTQNTKKRISGTIPGLLGV